MIGYGDLDRIAVERNLQEVENKVAAALRGYLPLEPSDWRQVENTGLRLSLDAATLDLADLPTPDGTSDLALLLLARTLGNSSREAEYSTSYLSSLAALSFAAAGNFPTAKVVARSTVYRPGMGPFEAWAVAVLGDRNMRLVRNEPPPPLRNYAKAEGLALAKGLDQHFASADAAFDECVEDCIMSFPSSDSLLLLLWAQVRQRLKSLSAARILNNYGVFEPAYIKSLLKTASPLLYPTQALALEQHRLINSDQNSLVLLPTSTGKSLLGELAIVASLSNERPLGVYLAPYRALTDQIFRRMRARLASINVATEVRRGGYLAERTITGQAPTVLVATPEAFDAFLRTRPELIERIGCCVFDEFHLVEQPVRGLRYEALLGRLREYGVESNQDGTKIVALSPVVHPSDDLINWLGVGNDTIVQSDWRPTARRLAIAGPDKRAHYYTPGDNLTRQADPTRSAWSGSVPFPYPLNTAPDTIFAHELREHDARVAANVAEVAINQHKHFKLPILILASTRKQTRFLASVAAHHLPEVESDHPARVLSMHLARRYPYLFTLRTCLRHGIAYHNASLPNWVRERLEQLMEKRHLAIVAATTTLAEGVDLPFRVVVMADWHQWFLGQQRPMPTLLFRNIAGRCGRAGEFAEGDTIIVDNPGRKYSSDTYEDRYIEYVNRYVRPQPIQLKSGVFEAVEAGGPSDLVEMNATLESQFLAYIHARSPDEGQEETQFTSSLFAWLFPNAQKHVSETVAQFTTEMLAEPDYPVLVKGSPLELTEFGMSVLVTGLSPRSGIALAEFLRDYEPPSEPGTGRNIRRKHSIEWIPFIAALRYVIPDDADDAVFVAEVQSGLFHRIGGRGYPVNDKSFITVLLAWLSGLPIEEITYLTIRKRDLKAAAGEWMAGINGEPPNKFEEHVEEVAVFLNAYIAQQWAWALRGIAAIAEFAGELDKDEIDRLAKRIEHGVRHVESAKLLAGGCMVDRAKIDVIIGKFLTRSFVENLEDLPLLDWIKSKRETLVGQRVGFFAGIVLDAEDIDLLIDFLQKAEA